MLAVLTTIVLSAPVTTPSYSVDAFGDVSIGSDKMLPGLSMTVPPRATIHGAEYFLDTHILTTDATERLAKHLTQFPHASDEVYGNGYGSAMATLLHSAGVNDGLIPVPADLVHERLVNKFGTPPAQIADAMSELSQLAKAATPVKLRCSITNDNDYDVDAHDLQLEPLLLKGTTTDGTAFQILSKVAHVGGPTIHHGTMSAKCEVHARE